MKSRWMKIFLPALLGVVIAGGMTSCEKKEEKDPLKKAASKLDETTGKAHKAVDGVKEKMDKALQDMGDTKK
ncbi:hypothetical protein HY256_04510 [Candidatus Sumerlaeota bacterium]|nr:hypothetical protein [Candidatus Sumerlaeota bacterium]